MRRRGHDVDTVVDEGLGGGHDDDVVAKATAESRLLITLDRGLGDVRRYPPGSHGGILVLRVEDQSAQSVVSRLEGVVDHHAIEALSGAVAVAARRTAYTSGLALAHNEADIPSRQDPYRLRQFRVTPPATDPARPMTRRQIMTVLGALMISMLLAALDQTIVGTALPTIVGELRGY